MELSSVTLFKFIKITFLIQIEIISILDRENVNTFKSKISESCATIFKPNWRLNLKEPNG